MFLIVNDTKPFMKPGCSVSHSSNMMHPCKWAIGDMLSGKNILQTVDPSILKKTWKQNFRLFMKNNYLWKNAYWKILLVFLSNFFKGSLKFMLPVFLNSLLWFWTAHLIWSYGKLIGMDYIFLFSCSRLIHFLTIFTDQDIF